MAAMVRRTDLRMWPAPCETEMATPLSCQILTSSERSELFDERRRGADAVTAVGFVPMLLAAAAGGDRVTLVS
jgi:hypothetical protein